MKKTHIMIYVILAVIFSASALALDCSYSPTPTYNPLSLIYWECITNENTTCFTYVEYDGSLIQAQPYPSYNRDQNSVREGFECNDICTVSFSQEDLRTDRNVTFGVVCGDETFEVDNIVPELKIATEQIMERAIYLRNNASYLILLGFLVFLSIIGWGITYRIIKGR